MRWINVEGFTEFLREQLDWDRRGEESAVKARNYEQCIVMEAGQEVYRDLIEVVNGDKEYLEKEFGNVPKWILDEE